GQQGGYYGPPGPGYGQQPGYGPPGGGGPGYGGGYGYQQQPNVIYERDRRGGGAGGGICAGL
ncbi:hypothetical protein LTR40_002725, partial [Exophiala xenobiotica]